jgi:hypothetical protein
MTAGAATSIWWMWSYTFPNFKYKLFTVKRVPVLTSACSERKGEVVLSFSIFPKSTLAAYSGLLGYDTVHSGMWLSTFHSNMIPSSSDLKMEAVCFSVTLVRSYQTIRCRNQEDHNTNFYCLGNLKSYIVLCRLWSLIGIGINIM